VIVIDASVLANAIADDGADGNRARVELRSAGDLATPDLADVETVAVLRKRWLAGTLTARRFAAASATSSALNLDRYPTLPLMRRAYELRQNVTAYDASYLALAELLSCELLTADKRLAHAPGAHCPVRTLPSTAAGFARRRLLTLGSSTDANRSSSWSLLPSMHLQKDEFGRVRGG
jgi:predicted nucleic acid-binding protein